MKKKENTHVIESLHCILFLFLLSDSGLEQAQRKKERFGNRKGEGKNPQQGQISRGEGKKAKNYNIKKRARQMHENIKDKKKQAMN